MKEPLKIALYVWHHRAGYLKEFSYPEDYSIAKEDIELLFFSVLGSKRRRAESLFSKTKIRNKNYFWYYFGANRAEPSIFVIEGQKPEIMQLVVTLALNLKLSYFKEISPLGFDGLRELANKSESIRDIVFKLNMTNPVVLNTLGLIYSRGQISFSDLVKDTILIKPTPSIKDLSEIISILRWLDLIELFYPEGETDVYITYKKLVLVVPEIDTDYIEKLKNRLKDNLKTALINIHKELLDFKKPGEIWYKMSKLAKIIFFERYRVILERIKNGETGIIESSRGNELDIINELIELGVLTRFIGGLVINYEPRLKIYQEKELENLGYL